MKKLFLILFCFNSCFVNYKSTEIILNISAAYKGWVYVVSSNVASNNEYYLSNLDNGIFYVSSIDFLQDKTIRIKIIETGEYITSLVHSSRVVFYPEFSSQSILYQQFYFPVESYERKDSMYQLKKNKIIIREINQFQYYYYNGILDTTMIKIQEPRLR